MQARNTTTHTKGVIDMQMWSDGTVMGSHVTLEEIGVWYLAKENCNSACEMFFAASRPVSAVIASSHITS